MNFQVIGALVMRYVYLYTRTPVRMVEMVFWPMVDIMVWGFLTVFLKENTTGDFPKFIVFLIGAMIMWDILFRAQQGVAISFLEDVWTRNLLNVFVAPVRTFEYVGATFIVGLLRITVTAVVLTLIAWFAYAFNIFVLGWYLIPFFINVLIFGWCLGMIATALILRWGQAAESLAWAVPFFIQPVVAVFYPVSVLPGWMQVISLSLPATHVFEGMRAVMDKGVLDVRSLYFAFGLNLFYLVLSGALFSRVLRLVRSKGLLTKFATQ